MPPTISAIDAHCHVFPDAVAPRAIAAFEQKCSWQAVGAGTIADLLASMDAAGITTALPCMIATRPGQEENILSFCCQLQSDRLKPLASVHPDTSNATAHIERIANAGLLGIKIHPMYQDCPIDDPRIDNILAAATANGLLVTAHCGLDIAFADDQRAAPKHLARVIKRHPRLKFLATHLGGWKYWDQVLPQLSDLDILFECSFSLQHLSTDQARDLILGLGPERVLLGTDWPWADQAQTIHQLQQLDLSADQQNAILSANAKKLIDF